MPEADSKPSRMQGLLENKRVTSVLFILLLIGLNILVYSRISFIFVPLEVLVKTVMLPLLLTGVVYYLLSPIVDALERRRVKRIYSITALYLLIICAVTLLVVAVIPFISNQFLSLVNNFPVYSKQLQEQFNVYLSSNFISQVQETIAFDPNEIMGQVSERATSILQGTWERLGSFVGTIKEIVLALITLPFILFYLLKDGRKLPGYILRFLPNRIQGRSLTVLSEMNNQVSSYIRGQIIVSFCIGVLLYIGYLIIGLEYSLTLAVIAACTAIVPYLGPAIAITPALIVAAVTSPIMLVKMIVVWTVVQLIEGKFISPQIMGKTLSIHPITIIFVILTAGNLFGIVGIVLAVPGYAVLKVITTHLFEWFKQRSPLYRT